MPSPHHPCTWGYGSTPLNWVEHDHLDVRKAVQEQLLHRSGLRKLVHGPRGPPSRLLCISRTSRHFSWGFSMVVVYLPIVFFPAKHRSELVVAIRAHQNRILWGPFLTSLIFVKRSWYVPVAVSLRLTSSDAAKMCCKPQL